MMTETSAFQPVTYKMPYRRLRRLSRAGLRKSYSAYWNLSWALLAAYSAGLLIMIFWPALFESLASQIAALTGIPFGAAINLMLVTFLAFFVVAIVILRRRLHAEQQRRIDYDADVTLMPGEGGLRFCAKGIEYLVKWEGIHHLLGEPDGLVVVHGGLFFLVPDAAFASPEARRAFLNHVEHNLPEEARARSQKVIESARQS